MGEPVQTKINKDTEPLLPSFEIIDSLSIVFRVKGGFDVLEFEDDQIVNKKIQLEMVDNLAPVPQSFPVMTCNRMPLCN